MKITRQLLEEKEACRKGIAWFVKTFPEGTELNEEAVAKAAGCPSEFVWWFYNHVQQDKRLYTLCGVNESDAVNWSNAVNRSDGVTRSNAVNWSNAVNESNAVNRSNAVNWSYAVDLSNAVHLSYAVNESNGVHLSNAVHESDGVTRSYAVNWSNAVNRSNAVNESNGVNESNAVNESNGVHLSNAVNRSFGVHNSFGVDSALFLANKRRSRSIFGKRVSKTRFEEVWSELYSLLGDWRPAYNNIKALWLANGSDWKLTPIQEAQELSKKEAWAGMPKAAIEYVRSLPEFDAKIFEEVTGIVTEEVTT